MRWKDGWINKWMDGWINKWMDGWMNEWIDVCIIERASISLLVLVILISSNNSREVV